MKKALVLMFITLGLFLAGCQNNNLKRQLEELDDLIFKTEDLLEVSNPVLGQNASNFLLNTVNVNKGDYEELKESLGKIKEFRKETSNKISEDFNNEITKFKYLYEKVENGKIIGTREVGKYLDRIQILNVSSTSSKLEGDIEKFVSFSKPTKKHPITVSDSQYSNHQVNVVLDGIYPVHNILIHSESEGEFKGIEKVKVEVALDSVEFTTIDTVDFDGTAINLGGARARTVRLTIIGDDNFIIQDIKLFVDEGLIILDAPEWSNIFKRTEGWTGADGVYSYNISTGDRGIGAEADIVGFVYSDTIVGKVYPHSGLRYDFTMINNSFSYYDTNKPHEEAMEFEYDFDEDGKAKSVLLPDAYIGNRASQLVDATGLKPNTTMEGKLTNNPEGTMWLAGYEEGIEIVFDFKTTEDLNQIGIWNYNGANETDYGTKKLTIQTSLDGTSYQELQIVDLDKASGMFGLTVQKRLINLNTKARFVKFIINESYSTEFVGLGKVLFLDNQNNPLFATVKATKEITEPIGKELGARIWLEDGIIIGDTFYSFVMLIKDDDAGFFTINTLGAVQVPIVNNKFDYKNAIYHRAPFLINNSRGDRMYFGGGVLDLTKDDGYVYVYGFKDDKNLLREMVVARTTYEDILNFNKWTFFDGVSFVKNIDKAKGILKETSPELSITKITSGTNKDKYMVTTMIGTISGRIGYSVADNPWGPFPELEMIYRTQEEITIKKGAFTYNAKMQPLFSKPGRWLLTYNVNSSTSNGLLDYNVYYPRGLWMIEVIKDENE